MSQQKLVKESFPISTVYVRGIHASLSQLKEKDMDLKMQEARCFLKSYGFLKKKDPDILYSKMLKGCLVMTTEKLSKPYLKALPTLGFMLSNGACLILDTSAFRKTESESLLSDILESTVPEKYFLSKEKQEKIMAQLKKKP